MTKFAGTALVAVALTVSACGGGKGSTDDGPDAPECSGYILSEFNQLVNVINDAQTGINNEKLRKIQRSCGAFRTSIGSSSCRARNASGPVLLSYAGVPEKTCTQAEDMLFQSTDVSPTWSNHGVPYEIFYGVELRVRDAETLNRAIMTGTSTPAYFQSGRLFDTQSVNPRLAACALAFEGGKTLMAGETLQLTKVKLLDQGVRFMTADERAGVLCVQRAPKQWTLTDLRVMFGATAEFTPLR